MIVKELKSLLEQFPDNMTVAIPVTNFIPRGPEEGTYQENKPVEKVEEAVYWVPLKSKNTDNLGYHKPCVQITAEEQ